MNTFIGRAPVIPAAEREENTRLSQVCTHVTQFAAAAAVYRTAGRREMANVLTEQLTDMLDELSPVEQRILMLLTIGQSATHLDFRLCADCDRVHGNVPCPTSSVLGGAS